MAYRPQFACSPTPPGFRDETFHYEFDSTNTPLLGQALAAGEQANNILLPLENDAIFVCRGISIRLGNAESNLYLELKTPHGDYIATVPVPISRSFTSSGAAVIGHVIVPLESEIECPAGSMWTLYLTNPTSGSLNPPRVTFYGVKRWKNERRAA